MHTSICIVCLICLLSTHPKFPWSKSIIWWITVYNWALNSDRHIWLYSILIDSIVCAYNIMFKGTTFKIEGFCDLCVHRSNLEVVTIQIYYNTI